MDESLRLVRAMAAHGCRPGVDIQTREVVQWLRESGMDEHDIMIGLVQASVRKWVVAWTFGTLRITEDGAAAGAEHGPN